MNMTLSKRGDYVVRSALALARSYDSGRPRKIREVVADTEVPRTFASQILADLVRAGLAVSRAGRDGGYWLARPPDEITVLQVVEAAEGPLRAERCALGEGPCRWEQVCPLHETWSAATAGLRDLLSRTTLAEVAARDAAIEAGTYALPADSHRSHALAVDVADLVHVELGEEAARRALAAPGDRLATLVSEAAAGQAPASGAAAGEAPGRPGRRRPQAAECSLGAPPARHRAGEPATMALAWRLQGAEAASRFEGELALSAVDAERSELRLSGTWHEEAPAVQRTTVELEQLAKHVVRGFLRRLARLVEEGAPAAGAPPAEAGAPAGPARRQVAAGRSPRPG